MILGFDYIKYPEGTDNSKKVQYSVALGDKPIIAVYVGDKCVYENENVTNGSVELYTKNTKYTDLLKDTTQIKPYICAFINETDVKKPCWAEISKPILVKGKSGLEFVSNKIPNVKFTSNGITYTPKGTFRSLTTETMCNTRDCGGKHTVDGKTTAYNRVIRSTHMDLATKTELQELKKSCNVMAELDLRGANEGKNGKQVGTFFPYGEGVDYYGPEYDSKGNVTYKYTFGPYTMAWQNIKNILNACITTWKKGGCIHIHCVSGADRTGIVCYILEAIAGVTADECIKDFELTTMSNIITRHYIDQEDWMRKVNKTLASYGKTLQEQVINYIKKKYGVTDSMINDVKKYMLN